MRRWHRRKSGLAGQLAQGHRAHHGPGMVVRVFWLLLLGLLATAASVTAMVSWRSGPGTGYADSAERQSLGAVKQLVLALDTTTAAGREPVLALGDAAGIRVIDPSENAAGIDDGTSPVANADLTQRLSQALERDVVVQEVSRHHACGASHWTLSPCLLVHTHLHDGSALALTVAPAPFWGDHFGNGRLHGIWLLPLALLFLLAAIISRLAIAPLVRLTQAANRFADNVDAPPLEETGPREIRHAIAVFNRMQARIRAHLVERTSMLAAIAHDLQTPLTRLRLRLEDVSPPQLQQRLAADLEECTSRVREGLDLASSIDDRRPILDVDLGALLQSASDNALDAGGSVDYRPTGTVTVRARPAALLRCVENLISNALKYGAHAELAYALEGGMAVIYVRDRGPGIPPADLDRVFEPFIRLEASRSRDTGGTGLGLYIVRNLIERQGGAVRLRNRTVEEGGGLEAALTVPLAS